MSKITTPIDTLLKWALDSYQKSHPLRTADMHDDTCCCKRCVMDKIKGYFKGKKIL